MGEYSYICSTDKYTISESYSFPSFLKGRSLGEIIYKRDFSVILSDEEQLKLAAKRVLAEKASKKAMTALEDFVYGDEDTEVQKKAVYALEDLPDGQGIPYLIKIAKTHPE